MLHDLKRRNKEIESIINKHGTHSQNLSKVTDVFQGKVREIERLEQEVIYKQWVKAIESHRYKKINYFFKVLHQIILP